VLLATVTTEWIGAITGTAALLGAVITIVNVRLNAQRAHTFEWIKQLDGAEFRSLQTEVGSFFSCREGPQDIAPEEWANLELETRQEKQWAEWERLLQSARPEDRTKLLGILAFANRLESLAGMYNHNLVDRDVVHTHAKALIDAFWVAAEWWIDRARDTPDSNRYQDLIKMRADLEQATNPRWHYPRNGRIKRRFV
jgi:hypothetical protein